MKRHLLTAGGGLLGILLTVVLLESGASIIRERQNTATPEFTLETPDLRDVPDLGGDGMSASEAETDGSGMVPGDRAEDSRTEPEATAVRDIAPEQFGLPQEMAAKPLERIEARTPLSDPLPTPEPVRSVLRHPVALSAGLMRFDGGRQVQLNGIIAQKVERTCDDNGKRWPCGFVARTAFRNFLRARALLCIVPKDGWQGTLTATCTVNDADPALWLAENGWAEATQGSPLAEAVETAKRSRLGFFGGDPRTFKKPLPLDEKAKSGAQHTGTVTPQQNP